MTTLVQKHLALHNGILGFYCFFLFSSVCLHSFEIFYLNVCSSAIRSSVFLKLHRFSGISPPCVYLSVWTCSPSGIVGVGVLSGLIAVWCLEWKTVLIREEVRENIMSQLSSLSHRLTHFFSLRLLFFLLLPPPLWLSTWLHRMMAVLHGSLAGRERRTDTKGWEKERVMYSRAACRLLKHRLPRCSPRCLPTASKTSDASRGATRAAKWVRNKEGSGISGGGRRSKWVSYVSFLWFSFRNLSVLPLPPSFLLQCNSRNNLRSQRQRLHCN